MQPKKKEKTNIGSSTSKKAAMSERRRHQQNQEEVNANLLKNPGEIQTTWIQTHKTVWILDEANCNK